MANVGKLLGARLRAMRRALGLTQVEFADRAGISQAQVSRREVGEGWFQVDEIADALERAGADPLDLLRLTEPPKSASAMEAQALLGQVDDGTLEIILAILRREAERSGDKAVPKGA